MMISKRTRQMLFFAPAVIFFGLQVSALGRELSTQAYLEQLHNQSRERVMVEFRGEVDPFLIESYGGKIIRDFKTINGLLCEVPIDNIESLKSREGIEAVVPDMVIRLPLPEPPELQPDEIRLFAYTGPVEIRWNNLEAGLNSKAAWDRYNLSGRGVSIAIIDTGVNYTLPDLRGNYLGGIDFVNDDDDPITRDPDEWHGTFVASLVVGKGVSKIVGVAYNAGFYAIRVGDSSNLVRSSDAISAIEWATEKGADMNGTDITLSDLFAMV